MAVKKIKLDFSKVEERSGWNTRAIPEGLHKMKVESVQETEAQDGTDMLVYALVPVDSRYKSRRFPFYCKLQQNQLWKLRDLLVAAGVSVPKKAQMIDPNAPVGKFIAAEVEDESNQAYAGRSTVQGTYGLDILDESDHPSDEPEDDEDDESEEEYDDEGDEGDDEEDELDGMTHVELKRLAKELGMTGYTKLSQEDLIEAIREEQAESDEEDEDDDLDDEDLEDEELDEEEFEDEDEEDEPEPAPRRRAAAAKPAPAPARRAPAKAAASTPARRVVKRR